MKQTRADSRVGSRSVLHAVAQLAERQAVLRIVDKIIPYHAAMGIVAGDAAHLPAAPLFRRVLLALERMPFSARYPHDVRLADEMAVTRETELIDRFEQLCFILAAVRVMAGFAHPRLDRTMQKLQFLDLRRHIGMALITEGSSALGDGVLRVTLAGVAITAGIGACGAMYVFYRQHFLVADKTGIILFNAVVHLCRRRIHNMAGLAETLLFGPMHGHRGILRQNLLIAVFRSIKNRQFGGFDLMAAVKQVYDKFVDPGIP